MRKYVALLMILFAVAAFSGTALARPSGGIIFDGAMWSTPAASHVQTAFDNHVMPQ